jgi:hypothetical protein
MLLTFNACGDGARQAPTACDKAMATAKAASAGRPPNAVPRVFLPTIQACLSLAEWSGASRTAHIKVRDPASFVAQVCALGDLQGKQLCQQTHGLVPFG